MWAFSVGKRLLVRIKPSAVAIWVCFLVFDPSLYTILLLLAMLLHEAGHLLALFFCRMESVRITFSSFGAEMSYSGCLSSLPKEVWVALGGVFANLAGACLSLLFGIEREAVLFFLVASLCLAVLNLIPAKGLDGGRALEAVLLCKMEPDSAFFCMRMVSGVCLALLFLLSLAILVGSGFNFSLLLFTLYLSLSIFR